MERNQELARRVYGKNWDELTQDEKHKVKLTYHAFLYGSDSFRPVLPSAGPDATTEEGLDRSPENR